MSESEATETRASRLSRRLALAVCSAAVTLVVLELVVGRFFPVQGQVYALDAELLHDTLPSTRRIQAMPVRHMGEGDASRVYVEVGREGFRGGDLDPDAAGPRVLVLGDSLVMAENVVRERTFVAELGRALDRRREASASPVQAINAGRSGYGPDQALLLMLDRAPELAPDLIVHVLCAHNDLGDLARNKLFRIGADGGLERARPRVGERLRREFERRRQRAAAPALVRLWRFGRNAADRSPVDALPADSIDLYLQALEAQYAEHWTLRDDEVVSLFEDVYDADVAIAPDAPACRDKRDLLALVLEGIVAAARAEGAPLLFAVVPSAVDVDPTFGLRVDAEAHPGYASDHQVRAILDAVERAGGSAIDLTAALTASDGRYFVGGTDVHWNAAGQRAGAEATADVLWSVPEVREALEAR
ncbi:MAG: hypothetical protein AAF726_14465 [Planctomycetota bacterium]